VWEGGRLQPINSSGKRGRLPAKRIKREKKRRPTRHGDAVSVRALRRIPQFKQAPLGKRGQDAYSGGLGGSIHPCMGEKKREIGSEEKGKHQVVVDFLIEM